MGKIDFRADTLGELYGVAKAMGIPDYHDMPRSKLEDVIQSVHSAACRREAAAEGGTAEAQRQAWLRRMAR